MERLLRVLALANERVANQLGQRPDSWKVPAPLLLLSLAICCTAYYVLDTLYKLYLHPLSKFPGPRSACLSKAWLQRVSQTGRPEEIFEALHAEYGNKCLRIAPNELHISDVALYKTIYNQTSAYVKDQGFYSGFGTPHTVFAEDDPVLHKERRRLLNPFFSRGAVLKLEPLLRENVAELSARIDRQPGPYNIYNAVRCTTVDIISHYCTGKAFGQLEKSDANFYGGFLLPFDAVTKIFWNMLYSPLLRNLISAVPRPIAAAMSRDAASVIMLLTTCEAAARNYQKAAPASKYPAVFSALTHLSTADLGAEAVDLLVAGSDTTAFSLTVAFMNLGQNPTMKGRLVEELKAHISDVDRLPSLTDLESIPYLNACVRECIRIASPVPGRLPRVVPKGNPLIVDGQVVPEGTIVGISAYTMHHNRQLWGDDAASFNPDRWLRDKGKSLDQYMVSFSKGLRSCLGQNLAYAEIHIMLAYLFRKYDVQLAGDATPKHARDAFTYCIPSHGLMVDLQPY